MTGLETLVLAHRFLYYVILKPIISDQEYDRLEERAVAELPQSSPVHDLGSSLPESYPNEARILALQMLREKSFEI